MASTDSTQQRGHNGSLAPATNIGSADKIPSSDWLFAALDNSE